MNDSFAGDYRLEPPDSFVSMDPEYVEAAGTLGRRTAQFHLALAQEKKNAQFKPEKATAVFTEQLAETISREVQEVLAMLGAAISDVSPSVRKQADRVLVEGPDLLGRIGSAADIGENLGLLIRHHGDYHLGQVLRTNDNDFILLDFEGEPLRPLAERRSKNSPLKDIAGMIRSFHYAVSSALSAAAGSDTERVKLQPWGRAWYEWICAVFLKSYFNTAGDAPFLPKTDAGFILEIFLLEKVFYELRYELNNRPDWMHIPLAGIIDIIDGKKTTRREK